MKDKIQVYLEKYQQDIETFNDELEAEFYNILEQNENIDVVERLFVHTHGKCEALFDKYLFGEFSNFTVALIALYPELITTYVDVDSLPADDNQTSICDILFSLFFELKMNEAISIGVAIDVFEENGETINLTPNYKTQSELLGKVTNS